MPLRADASRKFDLREKTPKIEFLEVLKRGKHSQAFKVIYHGKHCFLKVFFPWKPDWTPLDDMQVEPFKCESNAHEKLTITGVSALGILPKYLGKLTSFDPNHYRPHLDDFLRSGDLPSAILLEFIPNMTMLLPSNYTPDLGKRFTEAFEHIHKAGVLHMDVAPRHLCMTKAGKRILILDFDQAQTYDKGIPKEHNPGLVIENKILNLLFKDMATDAVNGIPVVTLPLYEEESA